MYVTVIMNTVYKYQLVLIRRKMQANIFNRYYLIEHCNCFKFKYVILKLFSRLIYFIELFKNIGKFFMIRNAEKRIIKRLHLEKSIVELI